MVITPGTYLRLRREANGFTIADVAAMIGTTPFVDQEARRQWLALIEADEMPAAPATIAALRGAFPFSIDVLHQLAEHHYGVGAPAVPPICRICACTEWDACHDLATGDACGWAAADLCTLCASGDPDHALVDGDPDDDPDDSPDGGALPMPANDRIAREVAA